MSTGEGPARNTRARAARRDQTHAAQRSTLREEAQAPDPAEAPAQPDSPPVREDSVLTSIAEAPSEESEQVEEKSLTDENTSSDHETIRDIPEETYKPEQSYTTAPSLSADPEGFESSTPAVAIDKGKGRALSTPPRSETTTLSWGRRDTLPHLSHVDEEWAQFDNALKNWSAMAEKSKAEAIKQKQELIDIQSRVINTYHRASDAVNGMQGLQRMFDRIRSRYEGQRAPSPSPCALATQAIYAERGSNEGTAEYEHRQSAQARFEPPQPLEQIRVERTEGRTTSSQPRAPEKRTAAQMTSAERFALSMAGSRARAAAKSTLRARSTGPPMQNQGPGGGDPEGDPSDLGSDDIPLSSDDLGPQVPRGNVPRTTGSPSADSAEHAQAAQNALERDYARRARSQSQQLVGPMLGPGPGQGQSLAPIAQSAPARGRSDMDHDTIMIESLKEHIRTSLLGLPENLPELKGLRAKMPDAYDGEDDFDCLEKWLHGLLRFMKIHRLTGVDKDMDRILVTGTTLKGRAERWFSQEVEHPRRIIRNWTFESVIVALYRTFITTATSRKAMQHYMNIKYTQEVGITTFYSELLQWAGRLAEYPDIYSFKRRIFGSLPSEFRRHLALFKSISPEVSTIDQIVQETRHLEQTLTSLKVGRSTERQPVLADAQSGPQKPTRQRDEQRYQRPRNPTDKRQQRRINSGTEVRYKKPASMPASGDRGNNAPRNPSAPKGDTSKMMCYKCGKIGHIATDPKCPQYKKPERRQIYATQVVDDRSESELPDQEQADPQGSHCEAPVPESGESQDEEPSTQLYEDDCPEGSQYEGEKSSSEEYDNSSSPSEDDEPIYIRAMNYEAGPSNNPAPAQFEDADWQSHRDIIRSTYQRSPWMHGAIWEFTPRDGIAHIRGCGLCANFKEHLLVAGAVDTVNPSESSAWKIRDNYEEDLIRLGWGLAHEGGRVSQSSEFDALSALHQRNHQLDHQLQLLRVQHEHTVQRNNELVQELENVHASSQQGENSRQPEADIITSLCEQITTLNVRLEVQRQLKERAMTKMNELIEELEGERLDVTLQGGEADFWQGRCEYLQERCKDLEERLGVDQHSAPPSESFKNEDAPMRSITPKLNTTDQEYWSDRSSLVVHVGGDEDEPIPGLEEDTDNAYFGCFSPVDTVFIAAVRDGMNTSHEREFRSAQRYHNTSGERPQTSGSDRRCMAALVKVNGLEAYALLDSGSTTVSITHDFARVAKLNVIQLENPVPLQLGTVGSRSMINYGARTRLELGPITDNDAYLDVVNIDRYDMIIGTPFMRKHKLVLDFDNDTLSIRGTQLPTMTSGQEDLMLAKKRTLRVRAPHTEGQQTRTAH